MYLLNERKSNSLRKELSLSYILKRAQWLMLPSKTTGQQQGQEVEFVLKPMLLDTALHRHSCTPLYTSQRLHCYLMCFICSFLLETLSILVT